MDLQICRKSLAYSLWIFILYDFHLSKILNPMYQRQLQLPRNLKFSSILAVWKLHCMQRKSHFCIPRMDLRSPQFHIHVSVSDIYIPRISPHIFLQQNRQIVRGHIIRKSLTDKWIWKLKLRPRNSFSGNSCFEFAVWRVCLLGPVCVWKLKHFRLRYFPCSMAKQPSFPLNWGFNWSLQSF
jgi:hypothetical protein